MTVKIRLIKYIAIGLAILLLLVISSLYVDYHTSVSGLVKAAKSENTIVIDPQEDVSFLVVGDSGTGSKIQRKIALLMEGRCRRKRPEGILLLGDAVYPNGVTSVEDPQWQEKIFSMYTGDCLRGVPIFPVLGNHDYNGNVTSWIEMSDRNERWNFPSRHYSIVVPGVVTIYAIDGSYPVSIEKHGIPDFGHSTTPWTIAMGHPPLQSASATGGGHRGLSISSWLIKKRLCNQVDAYLAAHSHHLEYDYIEECNMDQYISGAGGGELYKLREDHDAEFAISQYGFLEIELSSELMKTRFFSIENKKIFQRTRIR